MMTTTKMEMIFSFIAILPLLLSLQCFLFSRRLRAYESHLSTVALSNVESSRTVSQILFDLANSNDFQE